MTDAAKPTSNSSDEMSREEKIEKLGSMIKDIKMAMLTTADPDGQMRSRPMASLSHDFDGRIYFFTREHSGKVDSIQQDQHVNLAYSDPNDQKYVSVVGRASLSKDRAQMEKFWNPAMKAWFPEGLEDPEITLIEVAVESAELWDSPPNKVVRLVGMAEALITGKTYDQIHGTHNQRIDLNQAH